MSKGKDGTRRKGGREGGKEGGRGRLTSIRVLRLLEQEMAQLQVGLEPQPLVPPPSLPPSLPPSIEAGQCDFIEGVKERGIEGGRNMVDDGGYALLCHILGGGREGGREGGVRIRKGGRKGGREGGPRQPTWVTAAELPPPPPQVEGGREGGKEDEEDEGKKEEKEIEEGVEEEEGEGDEEA